MRNLLSISILGLLFLAGCSALGKPTEESSAFVQIMDRLSKIEVKRETPPATPENPNPKPITVVTQTGKPEDPTGGSIPIAGVAVTALTLAWISMRRLAVAHENAVAQLAASVPMEIHRTATEALGLSVPVAVHSDTVEALGHSIPAPRRAEGT